MNSSKERRRDERFRYRTLASASVDGSSYDAHVLNISATGSLVAVIDEHKITPHQRIELIFDYQGETIRIDAEVMHIKGHYLGLRCEPSSDQDDEKFRALVQSFASAKTV